MYNTYLCDQNQQSIFSVFCTDLKKLSWYCPRYGRLQWVKLRHKGEQKSFDSPQKVEDFISSLSQQKTYAAALREGSGKTAATISPGRREGLDGRDGGGPSCPVGDDGRMDMDAC